MRIRNVPRGLPSSPSIVEQIELGAGMTDRRVQHSDPAPISQVMDQNERKWFKEMENSDPDPRFAKSNYHDPINVMPDRRSKREFEDIELVEGIIEDAIMYPNGAHLKIMDGEDVYFIFAPDTNFVVKGTKVKVIDQVTKVTHPYTAYPGSDELATEENHSLIIVEAEDEITEEE